MYACQFQEKQACKEDIFYHIILSPRLVIIIYHGIIANKKIP